MIKKKLTVKKSEYNLHLLHKLDPEIYVAFDCKNMNNLTILILKIDFKNGKFAARFLIQENR